MVTLAQFLSFLRFFVFPSAGFAQLTGRFFSFEGNGPSRVSLLLGVVTPRWP